MGRTVKPVVLRIEPAGACNFRCTNCPTGQGIVGKVGIMQWSVVEAILENIGSLAPLNTIVLYHGGEPLLNKSLPEMVKAVRPFCRRIKTVTNGSLITKENIREILVNGMDEITISIDGSLAEENDRVRVGCDFRKLVDVVRLVSSEIGTLRVTANILVSNSDNSDAARDFMLREFAGIRHVTLRQEHVMVWPVQSIGKMNRTVLRNRCDKIEETITVRWNGDVVPCCYDLASQSVMGNVLENSLMDIWNGTRYGEFRDRIANFDPPDMCKGCSVLMSTDPYAHREHLV